MMAWVRTGTSLITFGFTVYKFFQLDEAVKLSGRMLVGPREFAMALIVVGLLALVLGTVEHARDLRSLRRLNPQLPGSLSRWVSVAMVLLGTAALVAVVTACLSAPPRCAPLGDGLFTSLLRLVRLDDNSARGVRRRVVVVALLAWLPLLLLVTAQGQLLQGAAVPFVRDIEAHVRLLVVIPLLLVAEVEARNFLPTVVQEFPRRNLLPAEAMARYDAAVAAASRLRNSAWAEAVLIVLVYAVFMGIVWRQYGSLYASTWYAATTSEGSKLTLAGYWYFFVSLPIVQFLLLRWYLWIFAWARFLWQVSRIRLDLMADAPRSRRRTRLPRKLRAHLRHGGGGAWGGGGRADRQPDPVQGRRAARIRRRTGHGRRLGDLRGLRPVAVLRAATGGGEEGRPLRIRPAGRPLRARVPRQVAGHRARAPTKR